jgi:hypothetical protein
MLLLHQGRLPNWTPGCKRKPRLEDQRNNTGPIFEDVAHSELENHVTVSNMPNNKWKCVHQRQDEESVCDPPVKDLELLMCNSGHQCDPIRFSCGRTTHD